MTDAEFLQIYIRSTKEERKAFWDYLKENFGPGFNCPYIPMQFYRLKDGDAPKPKIGFKTRYGVIKHD